MNLHDDDNHGWKEEEDRDRFEIEEETIKEAAEEDGAVAHVLANLLVSLTQNHFRIHP